MAPANVQRDCNGAAGRTFCASVIVSCLDRYAMSAVLSCYLLSVYGLIVRLDCCECLVLMPFDS